LWSGTYFTQATSEESAQQKQELTDACEQYNIYRTAKTYGQRPSNDAEITMAKEAERVHAAYLDLYHVSHKVR